MARVVGVIPARLASTRLPGKPLRSLRGLPLIVRVYQAVQPCSLLHDLIVATDSPEVAEVCRQHDIPFIMTGDHPSGTDRVWEAARRLGADIVINIQGDEPFVRPEHVERLTRPLLKGAAEAVTTLRYPLNPQEATNPNVVKVVCDAYGRALYFSRAPIPYLRHASDPSPWQKHLGFYGYTLEALCRFHALPPGRLERIEGLEQLRLLEHGIPIRVVEAPADTLGIDTEEDLRRAERLWDELRWRGQAA